MAEKGGEVRRLRENADGTFDISPDDEDAFRRLQEDLRRDTPDDTEAKT
jgi:hypothetical protein